MKKKLLLSLISYIAFLNLFEYLLRNSIIFIMFMLVRTNIAKMMRIDDNIVGIILPYIDDPNELLITLYPSGDDSVSFC